MSELKFIPWILLLKLIWQRLNFLQLQYVWHNNWERRTYKLEIQIDQHHTDI